MAESVSPRDLAVAPDQRLALPTSVPDLVRTGWTVVDEVEGPFGQRLAILTRTQGDSLV